MPNDLFIKTGNTPLQQAGSNSIKLSKANLPAEKLQVDSFSLNVNVTSAYAKIGEDGGVVGGASARAIAGHSGQRIFNKNFIEVTANSGTASPYTQNLGSGTPFAINPAHITLKAWKRTS